MASVNDLLAAHQKKFGQKVGTRGAKLVQVERIPTGLFEFDMASGGGMPRGRCVEIYGMESSGKTNLVLKTIAANQRMRPKEENVYFDVENAFDPEWAAKLGVDVERLIVVKPDYAEQVVDMAESYLCADDIGVVAVDSLAAMVTTQELNSSADKANVGGSALAVGKLVRKSSLALSAAEKKGLQPLLVYVNQTRYKIGVMFGDPETTPGGNAPRFQAAMRVRCHGKNISDDKVNKTVPIFKETSFIIKKWKVPIFATHGVYQMVTFPHAGLEIGETDSWNTVAGYLKELAYLGKKEKGQGWICFDHEYQTLQAIKDRYTADKDWACLVREAVIEGVMKTATPPPPSDGDQDEPKGGEA